MKGKKFVITNAIIAALGGLLFGFDTAVISGVERSVESIFELNRFWLGFTVAIALIGTAVGALVAGKPGDKYGRKKVLIFLAVFYIISAIGSALAYNWHSFLVYRFLGGLAVGGCSVIAPMYIAEIAPAHLRGRLVALFQFNIVTGILLAYFSNYLINILIENNVWRWMLGVETFPAFLFFILLFLIPESPRWLVKQNKIKKAEKILEKIGAIDVKKEINDIIESLKIEVNGVKEKFLSKKYRIPIMMAVMIAVFNQLSGINAIIYYTPRIFEMAGLARDAALLQSVAIGFTNFIFTILAISVIDKFGRKTLLLIGSVGMVVFLGLVARTFHTGQGGLAVMIYLIGYIAFFAFSQGAVIWVFISEIFPNKVRAKGQSLGSFTHWAMAALVSLNFPILANWIGGGNLFLFFSLMMFIQFFFVWKVLPETKGKSLEQIQKELGIK